MKKIISAVLICSSVILLLATNSINVNAAVWTQAPKWLVSEDMQGIWVASVKNIDYPANEGTTDSTELKRQADQIIANCQSIGINNIFLQVRPTCDAFYKSSFFPWSRYCTGQSGLAPDDDFDPLEYWIDQCHMRGIKLHAWINPYRVTKDNDEKDTEYNSISDTSPAKQHPEYLVRHKNNYYLNPGLPQVRALVIAGVMEIARNYDVDGIHLDDYFYPDEEGVPFDDEDTFIEYGKGYNNKADWRRDNVNRLISLLNPRIKITNPDCAFGISPFGIWMNSKNHSQGSKTDGMEAYSRLYADTRKWAKEGWVDYIAPQIYWNFGYEKADYETLVNWWAAQTADSDTILYIGIADYRTVTKDSSSPWYGSDGISQINRQLQFNDSIPKVSGEIHYNYTNLFANTDLVDFYREQWQNKERRP